MPFVVTFPVLNRGQVRVLPVESDGIFSLDLVHLITAANPFLCMFCDHGPSSRELLQRENTESLDITDCEFSRFYDGGK